LVHPEAPAAWSLRQRLRLFDAVQTCAGRPAAAASQPLKGLRWLAALTAASLIVGCATPPSADAPEAASGFQAKPGWATKQFAVAAANPLATEAGHEILKAGGNALDAAVAVQMALALVEPQSSGIAGGAFLMYFDGHDVAAFDGRETAPAAADGRLFLAADGKPMPFRQAVVGGRSVGVPGAVRMLEMAHRHYGQLPWARLFEPAIRLATNGFRVSPRLAALIAADPDLRKDPTAASYFFGPDGKALPVGHLLKNPDLADVLRRIAREGSKALHEGEVAQAIVSKVRSHAGNPGRMTLADVAGYQARRREPLCSDYRARQQDYRICGFPPPGSGAIAVAQILGILANTNAASVPLASGPGGVPGTISPQPSADFLHLFTEASRLAFADRAQYLADPDFVAAPAGGWQSLIAPPYLAARAKLIDASPGGQSMKTAQPGNPSGAPLAYAPMPDQPEYGTSHISIVDAQGHAVALTTTIEAQFGARQMVNVSGQAGGFLLNNELTDFSFAPADAQGRPVANRVEGGKRPRSAMAPTLVFEQPSGRLVASAGSPGGAVIILYTAKALYGMLNWSLDAQHAIDLPNFGSLNGPSLLEQGRFLPATVDALRKRGAAVREEDMTSGLQAIQRTPQGWFGGADPRREGVVMGE
jgi:gamma-glutamyltranspeptidase/glutathione hydrolase